MAKTQLQATTKAVDYYTLWKPCGMTMKAAAAVFGIHRVTLAVALKRRNQQSTESTK